MLNLTHNVYVHFIFKLLNLTAIFFLIFQINVFIFIPQKGKRGVALECFIECCIYQELMAMFKNVDMNSIPNFDTLK